MRLVKLSPTKIETLKMFLEEAYNGFLQQQDVIDRLTGESAFETNHKAELGNAMHSALEKGREHFVETPAGWKYTRSEQFTPILSEGTLVTAENWRDAHPGLVKEMWHTERFEITTGKGHYTVEMLMKIDAIGPTEIHDHKTKIGTPDKYVDRWNSLQWKAYAAAFPDVKEIVYWNWLFKHLPGKDKDNPEWNYRIKTKQEYGRYELSYLIRPTGSEREEITHWIKRTLEFAERQGIIDRMTIETPV